MMRKRKKNAIHMLTVTCVPSASERFILMGLLMFVVQIGQALNNSKWLLLNALLILFQLIKNKYCKLKSV
jgi:hypothetical protein